VIQAQVSRAACNCVANSRKLLVESLEIISRTPSTLPSPDVQDTSSQSTLLNSADDSVEIINKTPSMQQDLMSPESIEITEDDSSDILLTPDETPSIPITVAPSRGLHEIDSSTTLLSLSDNTLTNSETESFYDPCKDELDQTLKATVMEKSMESFEIQTQVSDSTHSFEEIQHPKQEPKKTGSGQTSGDEMETATSSDIEIISSPNCDSSSTTSCNKVSPKSEFPYQNTESLLGDLRMKGHSRELSEISVLSLNSDESPGSPSENEKLLKRVTELSEVLEQREYKLVQMGRNNAELVEANTKLTQELEAARKNRNTLDMTNVQEEYTQRLSALEKKFQQSIRENSQLKKQGESLKSELESRVKLEEHEKMISEKEFVVDALKSEGEKLSKQILEKSNVIKKLRAKLKETDESLKRQETTLTELTEENQKYKKTLTAKDEIEKSQGEGINKLMSEKRKFEKESSQLKSQNEDLQQKLLALQTSHDALKKELSDKSVEMVKTLEGEKEKAEGESRQMSKELADLRLKIREMEGAATSREQKLRQECLELKQKLEETEFRIEDQKQEASLASIPLIRQLESLQSTLNARSKQWETQEKSLLEKLEVYENQIKSQSDTDKSVKDQVTHLNLKVTNLEEKLTTSSRKLEQTLSAMQQKEIEFQLHENDYKLKIDQLAMDVAGKSNDAEKFKALVSQLEEKLRLEREELEVEKKKVQFIQQQQQTHHHERQDSHDMGNVSPAMSDGLGSVESLHSHPWNLVGGN
jgi:TATA element modulatory factor